MLTLIILAVVIFGIIIGLSLLINKLAKNSTGGDNYSTVTNTFDTTGEEETLMSQNTTNNQRNITRNRAFENSNQTVATMSTTEIDPNKKYSKKDQYKMEKKKAKEEAREYNKNLLEMREHRKQEKEKELEERERKKEEERLKEEELVNKIREDLKKKEEEEYNKWKDCFAVQEEGEEVQELESENLINDFINYIKLRKVVSLEDLSGQFKIQPNDIVDKLNHLESQGRICGIIDDRGKYIYLNEKELSGIEKAFMQRGRINKTDLIKECNKIIRFAPTEEDKAKILEEQNKILKSFETELESSNNINVQK